MIDESTIYLLTRLDYIRNFMIAMTVISAILTVVAAMGFGVESDKRAYSDEDKAEKKSNLRAWSLFGRTTISIMILLCCALVFVPTTKEMCAIKVIPAVANCEQVQSLGADVVDLARSWMNELKPETMKSCETKK